MLEVGKTYTTRDGMHRVEISVHAYRDKYPYSGVVDGRLHNWREDGSFWTVGGPHKFDLMKPPKVHYFNVYPGGKPGLYCSESIEEIHAHAAPDAIAALEIHATEDRVSKVVIHHDKPSSKPVNGCSVQISAT